MPAQLKLNQFGRVVSEAFGTTAYHVGSSMLTDTWRDVDVRVILDDDEFERQIGELTRPMCMNLRWNALCLAFAALGREMTGLPIDFQIQQQTAANEEYSGGRSALIFATEIVQRERRALVTVSLDGLRALLEAATPGPWGVVGREIESLHPAWPFVVAEMVGDNENTNADAALIVAAVNYLPLLIQEIEGKDEALRESKRQNARLERSAGLADYERRIVELEAENALLIQVAEACLQHNRCPVCAANMPEDEPHAEDCALAPFDAAVSVGLREEGQA